MIIIFRQKKTLRENTIHSLQSVLVKMSTYSLMPVAGRLSNFKIEWIHVLSGRIERGVNLKK